MSIAHLVIGNKVSFELWPATIIGTRFNNAVVKGTFTYDVASSFTDVAAQHANVFSTLPNGTPNDPAQYEYVMVQLENGQKEVLGIPWIKESTIELQTTNSLLVTFTNITPLDLSRLKNVHAANGFTAAKYETISN